MSLVGTRPILQDELQKYELHHRARIAIKPGITGMSAQILSTGLHFLFLMKSSLWYLTDNVALIITQNFVEGT